MYIYIYTTELSRKIAPFMWAPTGKHLLADAVCCGCCCCCSWGLLKGKPGTETTLGYIYIIHPYK